MPNNIIMADAKGQRMASGEITLDAKIVNFSISIPFQPDHFLMYSPTSIVGTDNAWKARMYSIPNFGDEAYSVSRYGPTNVNASRFDYSNDYNYADGVLTFKVSYGFPANSIVYWYAW
jgi:hypothetical protein